MRPAMFARLSIIALLAVSVLQAQAPRPRKVFISVDMEGITGVVGPAQLGRKASSISAPASG